MTPWRLLLADDHQLFLDGLKLILSNTPEYEVVAEANDGQQVLDLLQSTPCELVVLDVQMKQMTGIEAAEAIKRQYPSVHILVVSMHYHHSYIKQLLRIGVDGYILKENGGRVLMDALNAIRKGDKYYSEQVTRTLAESFNRSSREPRQQAKLTSRELEVLRQVAKGHTTATISEQLFVAPSTIVTYRKNIMEKLAVKNTAEMISYSIEMGLLY